MKMRTAIGLAAVGSALFMCDAAAAATDMTCGYEREDAGAANWTALVLTHVELRCKTRDGVQYRVHIGGLQAGLEGAQGQGTGIWCSASDPRGSYWGLPVIGNSSVSVVISGLDLGIGYISRKGTCMLGGVKFGGLGFTVGLVPILTIR